MRHPRLAATVGLAFGVTVLTAPASWAAADIDAAVAEFRVSDHVYGPTLDESAVNAARGQKPLYFAGFEDTTVASAIPLRAAGQPGLYIAITTNPAGQHEVRISGLGYEVSRLSESQLNDLEEAHTGNSTALASAIAQ